MEIGLLVARASQRGRQLITRLRNVLRRYLPGEAQHLFGLTLGVGVVCGVVAVAFHLSIQALEHLLIDRALHAGGRQAIFWTVVSPMLGGLIAGVLLTFIVPGARGSGIPQVKRAFALEGGRVRFADALGKFFIGSLQIGTGASLGREGPTVQICAGATTLLARATLLPPKSMRRLLPVGVAAGIAAAFNAPIAAVTFTIEEIVGTLDHTVLSGVVVAAALAAVIERGVLGVHPVIEVHQSYGLDHASSLGFYALLGVVAGLVATVFNESLLKLRAGFRGLKALPQWVHPGVGGLVTGIVAMLVMHFFGSSGVTGGGYETLGRALDGQLGLRLLVVLCAAKVVATVFSYSSGGAGGIFAPALFVGGMLGGSIGYLDVRLLGHEPRQIGAFALVGMGAVFAGVIRAPITSVLIIFEMTGGYGLVLPLMLANTTAYVLARHLRPLPIYEALLEQDGVVLPQATPRPHVLEQISVASAMTRDVVHPEIDERVGTAIELARDRNFSLLPVTRADGTIAGAVALSRLRSIAAAGYADKPLGEVVHPAPTLREDAPLLRAIVHMNDLGTRQLLVTDSATGTRLVGIVSISDLVRAHARAAPSAPTALGDAVPESTSAKGPLLEASALMKEPLLVSAKATLDTLLDLLSQRPASVLVVQEADSDRFAVVLPEYLHEFSRDQGFQRLLIAADVARPAPTIDAHTDISDMSRRLAESGTDALTVVDRERHVPLGVVTRTDVASALLDWYARRVA